MLKGFKGYIDGVYIVKVSGCPRVTFWGFPAGEAVQNYRRAHGLKGRHIAWTLATPW